jgi:hypothetical protein
MQTWITDKDFSKSAANLDRRRLGAQLYEGVHVLASLLEVNDKLVNPKRSVANHPVAKFWKGCEASLLKYIAIHLLEWSKRGYKHGINFENFTILWKTTIGRDIFNSPAITDDLIKLHRHILLKKDFEFYSEKFGEGV